MQIENFNSLKLSKDVLKSVDELGFKTPSEVQQKAIPLLLSEDTDIVALAQTGTGKTAAFGLPLIEKINTSDKTTQALILSPTRELCLQITEEIKKYSKYTLGLKAAAVYGGANIIEQAKQIKKGTQIIVATPGRMLDMIRRNFVDLSNIKYSILDEADEMLNMGFKEDIDQILSNTPNDKNTWLFSATMPKEVARIASKYMHKPKEITVGTKNQSAENISHHYCITSPRNRYLVLKRVVDFYPDIFGLIFCRTKAETQRIAENLIEDGYNAASLHGDLSQTQRNAVMKSFRSKQVQMLIATDVAARGIDVDDITHVIHYQFPDEIETYTHRSGRTARAGKFGISISIITQKDKGKIRNIEKLVRTKFEQKEIPNGNEICRNQLLHLVQKVKNTEVENIELEKFMPQIMGQLQEFNKEDLIRKFVSMEFKQILNYYKKSSDLNQKENDGSKTQRLFINLGSLDGFEWTSMKDFIKDKIGLNQEEISGVDVMNKFSFFNIESSVSKRALEQLNKLDFEGRKISVEISTNKKSGNRRNTKNNMKFKGLQKKFSTSKRKSNFKDKFKSKKQNV